MKRIFLFSILFVLLGSIPTDAAVRIRTIKGSGVMRTETREVESYTGLKVSRGVTASLTESTPGKLVVEADEKIIAYVTTTVDNEGVLVLSIDPVVTNIRNCAVRISVPKPEKMESLTATSGATATCRTVVTTPMLNVRATSGARIEIACEGGGCTLSATSGSEIKANLSVDRCAIETHSGAEVSAKGVAAECKISAKSGASCKARNLLTERTEVHASSGASIRITCTGTLEASASSGGSVSYWGDCRLVNYKKSVSGSVSHKE